MLLSQLKPHYTIMNKLYFSFLSLCIGMPLWEADFSGSIAHVSNDNNTIIVTELPLR